MDRKHVAWLLVVLWMVVIFLFSHQPATDSAALSSGILDQMLKWIGSIHPFGMEQVAVLHHLIRKLAHMTIYGVLGILLYRSLMLSAKLPRIRWFELGKRALIIGMFYAMTDEIHQLFIVGRGGQFKDVLIDSLGLLIGIVIYYKIRLEKMVQRY